MTSLLKQYGKDASRAINTVLGESCTYKQNQTGDEFPDLMIKITEGKEIRDEFHSVIGFRIEASILKEDLDFEPQQYDLITTSDGRRYRVQQLVGENSNKWRYQIDHA